MNEKPDKPPSPGKIATAVEDALYWIIFDNPMRLNALNSSMWADLSELIRQAETDANVRVVLLRGAGGRAFSAGADISEFEHARSGTQASRYDALNTAAIEAIAACPKPVVAMISGYCLGGGLEIALACDLRIAAEGSSFAIPAAKLGVGYDARWIRPLLTAVSPAKAKEIMFTGRRFTHEEALQIGLVNQVFPREGIEAATRALAEELAGNAPLSIATSKATINAFTRLPDGEDLAQLDRMVDACTASEDYVEGRTAFMEKRKPVFKGR